MVSGGAKESTRGGPFEETKLGTCSVVKGLTVIPNAVTPAQEAALLSAVGKEAWDAESISRRVQHYGFRYPYGAAPGAAKLEPTTPLPTWATELYESCCAVGLTCEPAPSQVIVNEYAPGQGIGAHTDHERLFGGYVLAVSLGAGVVMEFKHKASGAVVRQYLPPRSAYKLEGDARYAWTHAIVARKSDVVDGVKTPRGTRVSVTFRAVK